MFHPSLDWAASNIAARAKMHDNARWTDKGAFPVCCCGMVVRNLHVSLAIADVCARRIRARGNKVIGKFWDYSGIILGRGEGKKCKLNSCLPLVLISSIPTLGSCGVGKQEVKLTGKASALLCYLLERAGRVVTKDELFQAVWAETVVSDAALTSCIQELRHALHDDARKPRYIETVHRRGFRFLPTITQLRESGARSQESVSPSSPSPDPRPLTLSRVGF